MTRASDHFARVRSEREAKAAGFPAKPGAAPAPGTLATRMAALLAMHRMALKAIKSRVAKIAEKAKFLPDYAAYVDGVLAAGTGAQDDVVVTAMLWRLDTGDFAGALEIAAYALRHDLAMPDYIARDLPTTVVEEIAEAVLAEIALTDAGEIDPEPIRTALDLTSGRDMPDEVRAKAFKALGMILKDGDPAAALEAFDAALRLDAGCGVKTEAAKLRKAAEKAKAEAEKITTDTTEATDPAVS